MADSWIDPTLQQAQDIAAGKVNSEAASYASVEMARTLFGSDGGNIKSGRQLNAPDSFQVPLVLSSPTTSSSSTTSTNTFLEPYNTDSNLSSKEFEQRSANSSLEQLVMLVFFLLASSIGYIVAREQFSWAVVPSTKLLKGYYSVIWESLFSCGKFVFYLASSLGNIVSPLAGGLTGLASVWICIAVLFALIQYSRLSKLITASILMLPLAIYATFILVLDTTVFLSCVFNVLFQLLFGHGHN
jgi:hypothetical protein